MYKAVGSIILFFITSSSAKAQDFHFISNPQVDFSKPFIEVLNSAGENFASIIKRTRKKAFGYLEYSTIKITGSDLGSIYLYPSDTFCIYSFGIYDKYKDAEAGLIELCNKISLSLSNKVMMDMRDTALTDGMRKMVRIGCAKRNGFFYYNMKAYLQQVTYTNQLQLMLRIDGGVPKYFNAIPKNHPIVNSTFYTTMKNYISTFSNNKLVNCKDELFGFSCSSYTQNDSAVVSFTKDDLADEPNAKMEMEALMNRLVAVLGSDYIYYRQPTVSDVIGEAYFIRFADFDTNIRNAIQVQLVKESFCSYKLSFSFITVRN
jgi:hypothetical protein